MEKGILVEEKSTGLGLVEEKENEKINMNFNKMFLKNSVKLFCRDSQQDWNFIFIDTGC